MKKLKINDRVRINKTVHPFKLPAYGTVIRAEEDDPYFPYQVELDETPNGYLSNKFWLGSDDDWEVVGSTGAKFEPSQLELDFSALLDEEVNPVNSVYCNCSSPVVKWNTANFVDFKVCTKCKKECV